MRVVAIACWLELGMLYSGVNFRIGRHPTIISLKKFDMRYLGGVSSVKYHSAS